MIVFNRNTNKIPYRYLARIIANRYTRNAARHQQVLHNRPRCSEIIRFQVTRSHDNPTYYY